MTFIIPPFFLDKLKSLQADYEHRTGVKLSDDKPASYLSTFFGAKDTATRKRQFDFLQMIYQELHPFIPAGNKTLNEHEIKTFVLSLRIVLVACLYIKSEIITSHKVKAPKSELIALLDEALGITANNRVDDVTKRLSLDAVKKWLEAGKAASEDPLLYKPFKYLSKDQLDEFQKYVNDELKILSEKKETNFPIASAMQPMVGVSFTMAGAQIGYVLGAFLADRNTAATSMVIGSLSRNGLLLTPWVSAANEPTAGP